MNQQIEYIMLKNHFNIARLVSGFLTETLTPEEMKELEKWRTASPENERLFKQLCSTENLEKYQQASLRFNQTTGWDTFTRNLHRNIRRMKIRKAISYAAILLFPLLIVTFVRVQQKRSKTDLLAHEDTAKEYILPGERKALLTLGSGKVIDLQSAGHTEVNEEDGTTIDIGETSLNYKTGKEKKTTEEIVYNKVEVPQGGEYSLFLADGTKVYMNAMSSLRFPVRFTGDTRLVELEGEAYFEVTPGDKPFIINTNGLEVEVLGTSFNISSYPEEDFHTTLVSGSVKISANENTDNRILRPSEQARFNRRTEQMEVKVVDVALYTSWIDGMIYFKDEPLANIMTSLSRWYDMEVIYKDENVKNMRFGCNVNRYKEIQPFLELLEKTGNIRITQDDKTIIMQSK